MTRLASLTEIERRLVAQGYRCACGRKLPHTFLTPERGEPIRCSWCWDAWDYAKRHETPMS